MISKREAQKRTLEAHERIVDETKKKYHDKYFYLTNLIGQKVLIAINKGKYYCSFTISKKEGNIELFTKLLKIINYESELEIVIDNFKTIIDVRISWRWCNGCYYYNDINVYWSNSLGLVRA